MKTIYLVGVGMGNPETLTVQAKKAIASSDLLIGAHRLTEGFPEFQGLVQKEVMAEKILEKIKENMTLDTVSVLLSGDVGFFSGAKRVNHLIEEAKAQKVIPETVNTEFIPGISSLQYFSSKLKISWEGVHVISLHGRSGNIAGAVFNHRKTFFLTDSQNTPEHICQVLMENGLHEAIVHVGERLSYPEERIVSGKADTLIAGEFAPLSVVLVENEQRIEKLEVTHGLADELFIRGKVPMTKSEIRSISLSKLRLRSGDILYDIGAGTGSVAVEMALQAKEGWVYAIEHNEEAADLIRTNGARFGAWNIKVIPGKAPGACLDLPSPDRAFIGGSGGNLPEILALLVEKNPQIRVVVNAITLETMAETLHQFNVHGFEDIDLVQVFVAHGKEVGKYHMMQAQNPIFILSGERRPVSVPEE